MEKDNNNIEKKDGFISYVQRMSLSDGPGIRTTVFLKGCNLRCKWCHNPETFTMAPDMEWISTKCIGCGTCLNICDSKSLHLTQDGIVRDKYTCTQCYKCISKCYSNAWNLIGKNYTVQQLCGMICADKAIFERTGGGVTFSGGEPMMQFPFLLESLKSLKKRKIHTLIQTNLTSDWSKYERIIPYVDFFMCDLKHLDSEQHQYWTGRRNDIILDNIQKMDDYGISYCLRTPVIPGVNDSEDDLRKMSIFVRKLKHLKYYELLPFHPLGSFKYQNLGLHYSFERIPELSAERMKEIKQLYELTNKY